MSQIKNFVLKKLGIRAPPTGSKEKDNSLSASIKSNGSGGSNVSSRSKTKSGSDGSGFVESCSSDGSLGDAFSTKLLLSNELILPLHNGNEFMPIPPPRKVSVSPTIQFNEKTKMHSEKSILSCSEKSMVSDVLSDDSSIFSLGTDLTMHDKLCSDTNTKKAKSPASMRTSTSNSSLASVLSVSTTTVATSEAMPTRQIDLINVPHPIITIDTVTDALEGDDNGDINDLSPVDGGVVSVLFAGKSYNHTFNHHLFYPNHLTYQHNTLMYVFSPFRENQTRNCTKQSNKTQSRRIFYET